MLSLFIDGEDHYRESASSTSDQRRFQCLCDLRRIVQYRNRDDELPMEYYRVFGPILHLSRGTLSRPDEWRAAVLAFPGVADCAIKGQPAAWRIGRKRKAGV